MAYSSAVTATATSARRRSSSSGAPTAPTTSPTRRARCCTISFHPFGTGQFLSQAKAEQDQPGYGYAVFRFTGNEAVMYAPQCSDQDKAKIEPLGVEVNSQFECVDRPRRRSHRPVRATHRLSASRSSEDLGAAKIGAIEQQCRVPVRELRGSVCARPSTTPALLSDLSTTARTCRTT